MSKSKKNYSRRPKPNLDEVGIVEDLTQTGLELSENGFPDREERSYREENDR